MRLGRLGFGLVSVFGGSPGYPIEFSDLPRDDDAWQRQAGAAARGRCGDNGQEDEERRI